MVNEKRMKRKCVYLFYQKRLYFRIITKIFLKSIFEIWFATFYFTKNVLLDKRSVRVFFTEHFQFKNCFLIIVIIILCVPHYEFMQAYYFNAVNPWGSRDISLDLMALHSKKKFVRPETSFRLASSSSHWNLNIHDIEFFELFNW